MKLINLIIAGLMFTIACTVLGSQLFAADEPSQQFAKVISVHDGDTVTVINKKGIKTQLRLANIDAPEIYQEYGKESRDALANLVLNKDVTYKVLNIDKYKRSVAVIVVRQPTGEDIVVNVRMVGTGNAWHYRQYSSEIIYQVAEDDAKFKNLGLWGTKNPLPPWLVRHERKEISGDCGPKRSCNEMSSCQEARLYLDCGLKVLDSDGDGVPCESLCTQ